MNPWHIYRINDYDWWMARSLDEATKEAVAQFPGEEVLDNPRQVPDDELDGLRIAVGDGEGSWECECGFALREGDSNCCGPDVRWNGKAWEHHHGYPIGHVAMQSSRSFRDELDRRIKAGPKVEMFGSSEN